MNPISNLQARLEAQGYWVATRLLAPGTIFDAYSPCETRIEAVFSGQMRIVIDGRARLMGPGDWVEIPAGALVSAEIIGDEPVLDLEATPQA